MTGLPYIARLGAGVLFAAAGDYLRRKNILTVGMLRKSFMIFCNSFFLFKEKFYKYSIFNPVICIIALQLILDQLFV